MLVANNVTILKFFLYITPEEQLERFRQRLDDPSKQWKISDSDYKEREYWDKYTDAYQDMMEKCSTKHAPWYLIPSNNKWFRNLAVSNIIWKTLEDMDLKFPKPTVDIEQIRKEYHTAKKEDI
jgi:polyphosphate kinase 2 (PPK2 family)